MKEKNGKKSNNQLLSESLHSPVTFKVYFFLLFLNNVFYTAIVGKCTRYRVFYKHKTFICFFGC